MRQLSQLQVRESHRNATESRGLIGIRIEMQYEIAAQKMPRNLRCLDQAAHDRKWRGQIIHLDFRQQQASGAVSPVASTRRVAGVMSCTSENTLGGASGCGSRPAARSPHRPAAVGLS